MVKTVLINVSCNSYGVVVVVLGQEVLLHVSATKRTRVLSFLPFIYVLFT